MVDCETQNPRLGISHSQMSDYINQPSMSTVFFVAQTQLGEKVVEVANAEASLKTLESDLENLKV